MLSAKCYTWIVYMHIEWEKNSLRAAVWRKTWGVLKEKLNMDQQRALAVSKDNSAASKWVAGRVREGFVPVYSALMMSHLEYCIQACGPQFRKDAEQLEQVQKKAMKMIKRLEELSYEEKLRSWVYLAWRRLWEDFIVAFYYLKESYKQEEE